MRVRLCLRVCVRGRAGVFPRELRIVTRPRAVRAWFNTVAAAAHETSDLCKTVEEKKKKKDGMK